MSACISVLSSIFVFHDGVTMQHWPYPSMRVCALVPVLHISIPWCGCYATRYFLYSSMSVCALILSFISLFHDAAIMHHDIGSAPQWVCVNWSWPPYSNSMMRLSCSTVLALPLNECVCINSCPPYSYFMMRLSCNMALALPFNEFARISSYSPYSFIMMRLSCSTVLAQPLNECVYIGPVLHIPI